MLSICNAPGTEISKILYCTMQKIKCSKLQGLIFYSIQKELIGKKKYKFGEIKQNIHI